MSAEHLSGVFHHVVIDMVRRDGPDLSARQFAVFMICTLQDGPHTIRGLAMDLKVSKPAITRCLDRLGMLGLVQRFPDPRDRRSVIVRATEGGLKLLSDLRGLLVGADADLAGVRPAGARSGAIG
ncbi:MarR family transcriptional regulator [Rhodovastum atsumiense]|uniref:MarR family transcriptional regulator n=2 Tax=Rhodovastum atsumiense TaxID=504468 RepID=A0A5M6IYN8_9PROT|nr:MarR family transcriptional regulator [Rhodovastum atsumiense]KAA5612495.1 MarR family transcriptional regulator [Rhodovastum atsumiense]